MKKAIILSAIVLSGFAAMAQDTSTNKTTYPLNNRRDTSMNKNNGNWNKNDSTTMPGQSGMSGSKPDSATTGLSGDAGMNNTQDSTNGLTTGKQPASPATTSPSSSSSNSTASSSSTTTDSAATATAVTDRVAMANDKMYLIKNGDSAILDKSYKLESGAVVSSAGNVKFPSGKTVQLKNGQFIELKPVAEATTETKTKTKTTTKKASATSVKKKPASN